MISVPLWMSAKIFKYRKLPSLPFFLACTQTLFYFFFRSFSFFFFSSLRGRSINPPRFLFFISRARRTTLKKIEGLWTGYEQSNLLSTGLQPTARGRNIALYVSNHEEQFDRLSGMTFAVVFYTGNKYVVVQRSKSTPEPRRKTNFFNLRFFLAYLVHR